MTFLSTAEHITHAYIFIAAEPSLEIAKLGTLSSFIVPLTFRKQDNLGVYYFFNLIYRVHFSGGVLSSQSTSSNAFP